MKDKQFLLWIHERLEHRYNENPLQDFMHKLKSIANKIDPNQDTNWTEPTKQEKQN